MFNNRAANVEASACCHSFVEETKKKKNKGYKREKRRRFESNTSFETSNTVSEEVSRGSESCSESKTSCSSAASSSALTRDWNEQSTYSGIRQMKIVILAHFYCLAVAYWNI